LHRDGSPLSRSFTAGFDHLEQVNVMLDAVEGLAFFS
jgi:hypothetical protein